MTYQSSLLPPRTIFLDEDLYQETPADHPEAGGAVAFTPKDKAAQKTEDDALRADIKAAAAFAPPTREL